MTKRHRILRLYDSLRKESKNGLFSPNTSAFFGEIFSETFGLLSGASRIPLISKVSNKEYFSFELRGRSSRAINRELYIDQSNSWEVLESAMKHDSFAAMDRIELGRHLYTVAISFCASIDLLKSRDQKTPGTFFEYFCAFFFSWRFEVEPSKSISVLSLNKEGKKLPTDYVFDLGERKAKFHLPVKTSTRERSIMLWAHQKFLDGVYGLGQFRGTPVLLAETKKNSNTKEVVEICLPEQWKLYQLYIAQLTRIYYLDLPGAYERLRSEFPPVHVVPFSDFFFEWESLKL